MLNCIFKKKMSRWSFSIFFISFFRFQLRPKYLLISNFRQFLVTFNFLLGGGGEVEIKEVFLFGRLNAILKGPGRVFVLWGPLFLTGKWAEEMKHKHVVSAEWINGQQSVYGRAEMDDMIDAIIIIIFSW